MVRRDRGVSPRNCDTPDVRTFTIASDLTGGASDMQKEFNDTGLCVPERHYMVDIIPKITRILPRIEKGKYFTINRPRQFGKTTTLALLAKTLNQRPDYCALQISFEGLDAATYAAPERFIYEFLMLCLDRSARLNFAQLAQMIEQHLNQIQTIPALSRLITKLAQAMEHATPPRALVLLIDEVDKSL